MKKRLKMTVLMDSEIDLKNSQWDFAIHNSPWIGGTVVSGIGRRTGPPAYVARRAGTTDNLMLESTLSSRSGTMNLATE